MGTMMLGGCSGSMLAVPPEPKIMSAYSAECTVTAYITPPDKTEEEEFTFGGRLTRLGTGFWELDISSPDTLKGMVIKANDDCIRSELGSLSFDTNGEDIPANSPFAAVFSSLDKAAASSVGLERSDDEGWKMVSDTYTVIFDNDGIPVSMACSSPRITAEFSGFELPQELSE